MRRLRTLLALGTILTSLAVVAACGGGAPAPTPTAAKPAAPAATAPAKAEPTKPAAAPAATAPAKAAEPTKAAAASSAPALTKEYKMSLATGGTAGTYYPFGGALSSLWSKHIKGVSVTAETTGASVENLRLLNNKTVELALTQNDIADYAYNGTEMFKEKVVGYKGVAALFPELIHLVVMPNVNSFADLKGKKIVVGPAASGTEANTRLIMEANGMSYKDLGKTLYLSNSEAAAAMKDRQVDGMFQTSGVPMAAVVDVSTNLDVKILPIDGDVAQKAMTKYPFFVPAKIPSGVYKGVNSDVSTIAVQACLVARDDLDADVVYWLTKTLVEQQAELAQAHAKGKDISKASVAKGLTIPWHPGAEKYYKEAGILK